MIVVTGGAGFIGSNLVAELKKQHYMGVIVLDVKNDSLDGIYIWLTEHAKDIDVIFHLGAITDTTLTDDALFNEYNLQSSIFIWNLCVEYRIPLIYASSAATYGDGLFGFDDEKSIISLQPLNPYGWSKQNFDLWVQMEEKHPPYWYGLKFFNVYGFGESEKGRMASMVYHAYNQIKYGNGLNLFKSYNSNYEHGGQLRDFIYVDDIVNVCLFMYDKLPISGIYNVGTGKARTFNDLAKAVFKSLGKRENITYIDMPNDVKYQYQYFTEAKTNKLRKAGYDLKFHELENGVEKYINKLKYENC
jgi:ADP-L-glycero-D-manno-heptose 6-epimerase